MGMLSRLERTVEGWESALLTKVFRIEPVELFDTLRQICDEHTVVCSESRILVPNAYTVELADAVHDELAEQGADVGHVLTDVLSAHAGKRGYEWAGPLTVHVLRAEDVLPNGRYRVSTAALAHVPAVPAATGR